MPFHHSHLERQTGSQARTQSVPTPMARAPLDGTPAVPQLRANFDRGLLMEERTRAKKEESDGTEASPALVGESQGTGDPTLGQYN
ncbi:hypothetical protein O181_067511 [Austropuccinia psidii MF-1]|uniref:Uncharacterized protein n=1 Tax=Austropuccinia psidii MF-1 TaxID=1389203 RepID=A0A9Q3EZS3_9BASI|nr:hypothetical protein [Austropuccinia psidii MF-1]